MKKWTDEELKAYVLIYAMNADNKETQKEKDIIKSKVNAEVFDKMYQEFTNDKDYDSIRKINDTVEHLGYCKNKIRTLFNEIKEVFDADENFSIEEKNFTYGLKRALSY